MTYALPWLTAVVIGLAHSLEPDHVVAVTTFVSRRPGPRAAVRFGLHWGIGHSAAVLVVGGTLVAVGVRVPETLAQLLEFAVGVVLVALGLWVLRNARALHAHEHLHADGTRHTHLHSHAAGEGHEHGHAVTFVGALHGLAGTGPVISLLPVALLDSRLAAGTYLALFGLGTIAGMVSYALMAGFLYARMARRSVTLGRALAALTGLVSLGVGGFWIARAV